MSGGAPIPFVYCLGLQNSCHIFCRAIKTNDSGGAKLIL